jgi:hypothetical protein
MNSIVRIAGKAGWLGVDPSGSMCPREWPESLRVFGRLPVTGARACTEAGVRKASREETAGGVCVGGAVGLWGFSARV